MIKILLELRKSKIAIDSNNIVSSTYVDYLNNHILLMLVTTPICPTVDYLNNHILLMLVTTPICPWRYFLILLLLDMNST